MNLFDLEIEPEKEVKDQCKGKVFRALVNSYVHNNKYVYEQQMSLLKRKSCKGCEHCGWMMDELNESVLNGDLPIIDNIKHNRLYKLTVNAGAPDWESGYIEDYDLEFKEIKS